MGAVICHGHQQSTPIRVRKRRGDLVGERRADLAWEGPEDAAGIRAVGDRQQATSNFSNASNNSSKQQTNVKKQPKNKKSRTNGSGARGAGILQQASIGASGACCCMTEHRVWNEDCALCRALREEHDQEEYTQVLNSEMSTMIDAVYDLSSLVERKLKEKQKTRQDVWKREGTFGIFVSKGEDGRRRIVVRDGWTSYHIDVVNAVGGEAKGPSGGPAAHQSPQQMPAGISQQTTGTLSGSISQPQPALSPASLRSNNASSGGVLVRRVQPRVLTRSHTTTTGGPETAGASEDGATVAEAGSGSGSGRAAALPPVDTLEACERAAQRLREVASHLQHGDVPLAVLQKTLTYAACVLDTVCQEETRKLLDEDDELSEVRPDAVPTEVREWLESTFTRQSASLPKRRSEDKPRFRSVANAIRAGIMVDRLYRRVSPSAAVHLQVPPPIVEMLKNTDDWSFNVFKLNELSGEQALRYLSFDLLNRYGLVHKFKMSSLFLENFLTSIEAGYKKYNNPYHNNMHAADVTQTVHFMLCRAGVANWLTDLEIFATIFAAIIHDYEHTGTTNNFHVMSRSETALIYNDRSVLENHHISSSFRVMQHDDCNILANLSRDEYREFRSLVIEMVLATDMTSHFQQVKTMKTALGHHDFSLDKPKSLCLILHACDISHPSKDWELHTSWTGSLMEEFFKQGDKERELGLPYSPLCDRNTTMVAESQIGFIDFILGPTMDVCSELIMKIYQQVLHQQQQQRASTASTGGGTQSEEGSRSSSVSSVGSQDVPKEPARPWIKFLEMNRLRWQERAAQADAEEKEKFVEEDSGSVTNNGNAGESSENL
ncbi:calcium/calmodulin-dependent 3',5'-cyclic nucleotide phosphodiesterase 1A-like isoform X3 [Varroa jacobsoni]|uniref:Phosphodiesterase n=1 Tax=Varroa destructor TaxID=109461 RepID=A0A7M7KW70_VARDE|nr:calcium/calmodulin-dependent 3',5'-cyclic nucleotide phosphodiesterase 1A-like isoform X2 [Varroa destructor]XP_022694732.1 calcium/calmodulin-dependent 3',5'-cyclic nucleotide phosphodiesterase 1A-like isoform X3 [Varroa jacobsoni]